MRACSALILRWESAGYRNSHLLYQLKIPFVYRPEVLWEQRFHIKYDEKQNDLTYSLGDTGESLDIAREAFRKVKNLTIKLAEVENSAYRLATNIKKTQKRANALKNITIPMYTNLVYNINNALEEKEREEFTRLKVIKRRQ